MSKTWSQICRGTTGEQRQLRWWTTGWNTYSPALRGDDNCEQNTKDVRACMESVFGPDISHHERVTQQCDQVLQQLWQEETWQELLLGTRRSKIGWIQTQILLCFECDFSIMSPSPHRLGAECLVPGPIRVEGGGSIRSGACLETIGPRGNTLEIYGLPHHIPSPPILSHPLYFLATMMGSEPPCHPVLRKWKHWNYELKKSTIFNVYARHCVIAS
jgi:hypothetical protein